MPSNFERWEAEYKIKLAAAIKRKPDNYCVEMYRWTPEEYAENVGGSMARKFRERPFSVIVSPAMRAAAKKCGAAGTSIKAIHKFITAEG